MLLYAPHAERPSPPHSPDINAMKIEVHNFGPIAEGRLDLRPLTVFAGPSNTGKSWMATLIYALGNYLNHLPYHFRYHGIMRNGHDMPVGGHAIAEKTAAPVINIPENPQDWLDSLKAEGLINLKDSELKQLSSVLQQSDGEEGLISDFVRCRGLISDSVPERVRSGGKMQVRFQIGSITGYLENSTPIQIDLPQRIKLSNEQSQWLIGRINALPSLTATGGNLSRDAFMHDLTQVMMDSTLAAADPKYRGRLFYLPEERGSLMNTLSTLTSGLIRHASRQSARSGNGPSISGVVGDFMEWLQEVGKRSESDKAETSLSSRMEDAILCGEVKVQQPEVGLPVFNFHPKGWKAEHLPMTGASSMVSELAPVVLFLRYLVRPGDTLILEEPEAHLHPAAQMLLTEEIAAWMKAGIRVVLTTHSEWVVEKISNMVFRGNAGGGIDKDKPSLNKEDVGVWLFDFIDGKKPEQGTAIKEIPWEMDEAGYEVGFYDSAMKRVDDWDDIENRVAEDTPGT